MLQYRWRALVRAIVIASPPEGASATSSAMSKPYAPHCARYGNGAGSCGGPATRNGSSASSVTIQGEIEVAKLLLLNGPSGTYSHCWIWRALQSLRSTSPKIWASAFSTAIGSPSAFPSPTTNAISSSKSSFRDGPNVGRSISGGLVCPRGRRIGVPLTTTELERPLYATGRCSQFGSSAFLGSRNIVPTLVACSRDE